MASKKSQATPAPGDTLDSALQLPPEVRLELDADKMKGVSVGDDVHAHVHGKVTRLDSGEGSMRPHMVMRPKRVDIEPAKKKNKFSQMADDDAAGE